MRSLLPLGHGWVGGCFAELPGAFPDVTVCPPPNFCDHRMVRAPSSESPCHLHCFLASTIRWFDQRNDPLALHGAMISSRKWGA